MKKTTKGMVSIPTMTLNALKNMLFSNGGVDLTNIINDICADEDARDITAINVALAFNGTQLDIDKAPRYERSWGSHITKYEFVNYSLILGKVSVKTTECGVSEEHGDLVRENEREEIQAITFERWMEMATDAADVLAKMKK